MGDINDGIDDVVLGGIKQFRRRDFPTVDGVELGTCGRMGRMMSKAHMDGIDLGVRVSCGSHSDEARRGAKEASVRETERVHSTHSRGLE